MASCGREQLNCKVGCCDSPSDVSEGSRFNHPSSKHESPVKAIGLGQLAASCTRDGSASLKAVMDVSPNSVKNFSFAVTLKTNQEHYRMYLKEVILHVNTPSYRNESEVSFFQSRAACSVVNPSAL